MLEFGVNNMRDALDLCNDIIWKKYFDEVTNIFCSINLIDYFSSQQNLVVRNEHNSNYKLIAHLSNVDPNKDPKTIHIALYEFNSLIIADITINILSFGYPAAGLKNVEIINYDIYETTKYKYLKSNINSAITCDICMNESSTKTPDSLTTDIIKKCELLYVHLDKNESYAQYLNHMYDRINMINHIISKCQYCTFNSCTICINKYYEEHGKNNCPMCKQKNEFRYVYNINESNILSMENINEHKSYLVDIFNNIGNIPIRYDAVKKIINDFINNIDIDKYKVYIMEDTPNYEKIHAADIIVSSNTDFIYNMITPKRYMIIII
jgi:hypothetical protein